MTFTEDERSLILLALGYYYGARSGELGLSRDWGDDDRKQMCRLGAVIDSVLVKFGGQPYGHGG